MQIIFDHISIKSASTTSHRLKTRYTLRGRAWNDLFNAKFVVTKIPRGPVELRFVDAEVKTSLEKEWRDALAISVKALTREEIKRFVSQDIPVELKDSVSDL